MCQVFTLLKIKRFSHNTIVMNLLSKGAKVTRERDLMHQSIPAGPSSPRADPRELALFFALDGKFPGVGTLELSNPPGWGRKKRANAPSSVNTVTFFIDRTVE